MALLLAGAAALSIGVAPGVKPAEAADIPAKPACAAKLPYDGPHSGKAKKAGKELTVTTKTESGGLLVSYGDYPDVRLNGFSDGEYCTTADGHLIAGPYMFADDGEIIAYGITWSVSVDTGSNASWGQELTLSDGRKQIQQNSGGFAFLVEGSRSIAFTSSSISDRGFAVIFDPNDGKGGDIAITPIRPDERSLNLDANGGAWADGATVDRQTITVSNTAVTADIPTRAGWQIKGWNTKPDGTGDDVAARASSLKNGQTIYAIWENDAGDPTRATIDCAARSSGTLCSVVAYYAASPMQTRELVVTGTNKLAWTGTAIKGVNLDASGYNGNVSCVGTGNGQCYYVSVAKNVQQPQAAAVAAVPTTGAPSSDLIAPAALLAAGMVGGGLLLRKRRDRNRA